MTVRQHWQAFGFIVKMLIELPRQAAPVAGITVGLFPDLGEMWQCFAELFGILRH
jgi:hypothetical protein